MNLESYLDYLVSFIKETVEKANARGVIFGISGGVDSAVVSRLAQKAFPNHSLGVFMPIHSSSLDYECVEELVISNNLKSTTINLETTAKTLEDSLIPSDIIITPIAQANLKARLRMATLYALAQTKNYLVLGTDNYDEWYLGYFTKYGDGGVDVAPLIHLSKGDVFAAAKLLNVPKKIINRAPTASLWDGQTDEKEIGHSYKEIDDYLLGKNVPKAVAEHIELLHKNSRHKRQGLILPKPYRHFAK